MSAGLLMVAALLGALAGWATPVVARRFAYLAGDRVHVLDDHAGRVEVAAADAPGRMLVRRWVLVPIAAALFGGLSAARGADPALPAFLLMAAVGLVLAMVDLSCLRLPDPLIGAAALAGGLGLLGAAVAAGAPNRLLAALAGAAVSLASYVLLALLPGSRLGFGDVKLAAVLGLPLGWLGWPALWLGLILPHVLNGVVVLGLLVTRRVRRDSVLPFGPALLVGTWLAVLLA
ncbi:prepilin peptidase [Micromonospora sp. NPDC093277]|uniref:prepilin peptidase n=1 Tax=Micromonospora sp. NPDC093277 TaxID=3364291 RepID=UPI00381A106B